jgi:galactose mutarotase-like enzyme
MRVIVLENDVVRISVNVDKGTEIYEYLYKPTDTDLMWLTENGVHNPNAYMPTSPDPISTFIDYYSGGWQEVFPNGGPTSSYMGAQFGQHGEVAHMPWDYWIEEDTPERITVGFRVRTKKVPFELTKKLTLTQHSATLEIEELLENLSDVQLQYMWGHHLAYGRPFISEGSRIILPDSLEVITEQAGTGEGRVVRGESFSWPVGNDGKGQTVDLSILPLAGTPSDIVYIHGFEEKAWYKVESDKTAMGMKVDWDGAEFPYLWYWQEFGANKEYPWYGRHYNVGLEPFCGFPTHGLGEALNNGSAGTIGPGEKRSLWLKTTPYSLEASE